MGIILSERFLNDLFKYSSAWVNTYTHLDSQVLENKKKYLKFFIIPQQIEIILYSK